MRHLRFSHALIGLASLVLASCVAAPTPPTMPAPAPPRPDTASETATFAAFYRNIEARLVGDGLLRTDDGSRDTTLTPEMLAGNFERIALYSEYALANGRFVARETPSTLRRWSEPVRLQPHFGASVPAAQRAQDRSVLSTYAARLAQVSGHPIRTVEQGGNFHVLYLNREEQVNAGALIRQLMPGASDATIDEIERMPRSIFCAVYAFSQSGQAPVYVSAIAIIRAEHPDLLRRSCVHEEVAQGLGLPNDSPDVRPSIFNDDDEFALLTRHDELLLRMLYDRRLSVGMTPDSARDTVRRIAEEYLGQAS
ncbi:MAG: DUF2927 domain-containing protein [Rhodobacteraceae bacterium]|nr:DUF2927 domain-containing protein [Paracoccaceae bacterium]